MTVRMGRNLTTIAAAALLGVALLSEVFAADTANEAWVFGVISDTQWSPAEGHADRGVAGEIIRDVDAQFVKAGAKFAIAVGDITNNGGKDPSELDIRARYGQALEARGVRFFPLRGNHEATKAAAARFQQLWPNLPGHAGFQPGDGFSGGSSPDLPGLAGLTYSFNYRNAALVLLDQFTTDDGTEDGRSYPISEQQTWITSQLEAARAAGRHAFVLGHKNLLGQNHKDNLFGSPEGDADPGDAKPENAAAANGFIGAMHANAARLYLCGHDHMFHRAVVETPQPGDTAWAQEVITGSCSTKFYDPEPPYSANEIPLAQQRKSVGYCLLTIEGPCVTFDYYAVMTDGDVHNWQTPAAWPHQDSWGYSLNGREFVVRRGETFAAVSDRAPTGGGYRGTEMRLLGGTNDPVGRTQDDDETTRRDCANLVATGWIPRPAGRFHSDRLRLWGLRRQIGAPVTNLYVLALTYDTAGVPDPSKLRIMARHGDGWVEAVKLNTGGTETFVAGPYADTNGLGSYGVDTATRTVWAVLNTEGEFVVGS